MPAADDTRSICFLPRKLTAINICTDVIIYRAGGASGKQVGGDPDTFATRAFAAICPNATETAVSFDRAG